MLFVPSIRHRLTSPFTGEKSASSRITLWQSGIKAIKQSPVFGLDLGGYSLEYRKLITDQTLPDHNFPHNIFLDLWVETGLMGLIGMVGLIGTAIYQGLIGRKNLFILSVALFFIAFLFQGQIDNPYFKNDLAAVFWIILAII
jgi:O-antigen ligase